MPLNSDLVDANNIQTKRGIFRGRTQPPAQIVRSKLPSNAVPMKPNRKKFQSKIVNRKDPVPPESKSKIVKPKFVDGEIVPNVVEKPSIHLLQDSFVSNMSQSWKSSEVQTFIQDSCEESQNFVVNSVHSLVFKMEHSQLDQTAVSDAKMLLPKVSSKNLENKTIPWVKSRDYTPQPASFQRSNSTVCSETVPQIRCEKSFLYETNLNKKPSLKKFDTFIKKEAALNMNKSSIPLIRPIHVEINKSPLNDLKTAPSTSVDELKYGDNVKLAIESKHAGLFETELKTYHESLKKYDQEAKDVIDKFTESLDEKGKIIKKYEEELSLFNNRICSLQKQLEDSLARTRQLESTVASTTTTTNDSHSTTTFNEIKSENEKLKEMVKNLETKLAKRDLHIFNLKEVLSIETNKLKELNKAQEEINKLQRESIDKSREITILRDELKYASKMRTELVNEYDEKIVKLKKLLAIREYLLMKGKS